VILLLCMSRVGGSTVRREIFKTLKSSVGVIRSIAWMWPVACVVILGEL
jgi:hypothetical protein